MTRTQKFRRLTLAFGLGLALGSNAWAQATWPSKTITFVVPFTAGSATDVLARLYADKLGSRLDQTIVVDNKVGAGGTIGTAQVARAAPDGHTFVVVSTGHVVNPVLYNLNYKLSDLSAVSPLGSLPSALVAAPKLGVKTVKELVDKIRATPEGMSYASAGIGSAAHVNAAKFVDGLKLKGNHVPYKGTPQMLVDIAGNNVEYVFAPLISSVTMIRENKVVFLAVSSEKRAAAFPNVPTMAEQGIKGFDVAGWQGLTVRAGTPEPVIKAIAAAFAKSVSAPDVKKKLADAGIDVTTSTPEQFAAFVQAETVRWRKVIQDRGIKAE